MKIIDLLNKIANGEEVPKKIKIQNNYYEYYERLNDTFNYKQIVDGKYIDNYLCDNYFMDSEAILNDEVEIIEEDKKIEKIKSLNNVGNCQNLTEFEDKQQLNNHILKDKINKIIDYINNKD